MNSVTLTCVGSLEGPPQRIRGAITFQNALLMWKLTFPPAKYRGWEL